MSESTEDFSSFRAVSSVQQLLDLYSQQPEQKNPSDESSSKSRSTVSSSPNDGFDIRVEASRQMLERNLERLIVQQGMDAISQLTYAMTPEQIEKLILRTEQVTICYKSVQASGYTSLFTGQY